MKTYHVKFWGREINAIGIMYNIETTIEGRDEREALTNLYEKYDHVSCPVFKEIKS